MTPAMRQTGFRAKNHTQLEIGMLTLESGRYLMRYSRVPALVSLCYLSLGAKSSCRGFLSDSSPSRRRDDVGFIANAGSDRLNHLTSCHSYRSKREPAISLVRLFSTTRSSVDVDAQMQHVLPFQETSHRSATIIIPQSDQDFANFAQGGIQHCFQATVQACRSLGKSSIWVHVPMNRCAIVQDAQMEALGFQFHHTKKDSIILNLWLDETIESKIPEFATHNVGVGAVVINRRNEILCVQELRKNYMPWKTPTGLSDVGESIDAAAVREVLEETGIATTFRRILSFRQTHGMAHDRSDMFFVCQLDPVERRDENGNVIIDEPTPEASEIAKAAWIPLDEYRAMVYNPETGGHPMMQHVLTVLDSGRGIDQKIVSSVVPGRAPNAMYFPN